MTEIGDVTAALEALARISAQIRDGNDSTDAQVDDATAKLPPEAAAAARALLADERALKQRVVNANQARETLLAGVAHDLRNPLNTFAMSTGLLRDDFERDDVDAARDIGLVHRMERGIERMRRIIDDLVDASRIEARKVDLVRREEAAAVLVKNAIVAATPAAQERSTTLAEGTLDPSVRVSVDRSRMTEALAKAIIFTIRACGERAVVHVSAERIGDVVQFSTRATPPNGAVLATSHDGRGGIALVIARGLVDLHGSELDVVVGDRVSVSFTLPAVT
jgi:signal transduction histidine kinase